MYLPFVGSYLVRASRGRLPQPRGTAGFLQESHPRLRRRERPVSRLHVHETHRLARRHRLCRRDVLLRVSVRRQGRGRDFRTMDDFFLFGILRGDIPLSFRFLVLAKPKRVRGGVLRSCVLQ